MTAFTPNTGGTVKWDSLSGGSTNATLDTYAISNNTTLLIETDSYQCLGHSTAFGSLDTVSFSGIGGKLKISGENVHVIPFNTGTGVVPAIDTTISQAGSATCVDCGHAYLIKRGDAGVNTDFDSGAIMTQVAAKVTNWSTNSGSGYLNICAWNIENGSTGTQSGYVQIYYEVTADEIRCYVGEGFTTQDFLIRSGASTEWARYGISCAGGLTDAVTLFYIFEDQGSVTSVVVSDVSGDPNKGGRLRQFIVGGANFGSDEEGYNVRIAQVGCYKVAGTAADFLAARASETPYYTGSSLMFWLDWSDWAGDPWNDVGATYGAAGTFDFAEFDTLEGSTVSDSPGAWGGGGASAKLLGVWANWQSEPLAAAAAMPTSGFIKVKDKSGNFASGALTGISASATGADVVGWIEVRGADTAQITVPRVGEFEVVGDWFELGTTSGSRGQVLACPTTATVAGVFPGVQIETAPGSGVYKWFTSVGSLAASSTIPTTELEGRFVWQTTSGIRIGSDGTNNVGYLPASGCKVRIPNVILTCCTRTVSGSGPRVLPNATLATRQEYVTTNAGKITISKGVHEWYALWAQPFQVTLADSAFSDTLNISEQSAALSINRCLVAPTQAQINTALVLASCFGGGTIADNFFTRYSLAASGNYIASTNYITDVNFSGNRLEALAARGNATTGAWTVTQSVDCSWTNDEIIGGRILHVASLNPTHVNTTYVDTFNAASSATNPMSAIDFTAGTNGATVEGFLLPGTNKQPYTALVNFSASYDGTVKLIGSRASPLNLGSANQSGLIVTSGGNNDGIRVQRCYCSNTRTGLWGFVNSDNNITLESVAGDYADTTALAALNAVQKGCGVTSATTGQVSVYGSHWKDEFTAATTGRIVATMNEPTAGTSAQCAVTAGTPRFNSAGQVLLTTIGDQVTLEMPYFALAHSAAANIAPTITGTNTGNHTIEFQYDKGAGYNGSWLALNQTNWNAVGAITAGVGIRLKLRITCATASATNAITCVRVDTVTSTALQTTDLYPLETVAITLTGLKNPTEVRVFSAGTTTEIVGTGSENVTSGSHTFYVAPSQSVDISILALGYQNMRVLAYATASDASIPISQVLDRQYLNP